MNTYLRCRKIWQRKKKKFGRWNRWHWKHVPAVIKKREVEKELQEGKERCPWPWFRNQKGKSIVIYEWILRQCWQKDIRFPGPCWKKAQLDNEWGWWLFFFLGECLLKIRNNLFHPVFSYFLFFSIFYLSVNFVCFVKKYPNFPLKRVYFPLFFHE